MEFYERISGARMHANYRVIYNDYLGLKRQTGSVFIVVYSLKKETQDVKNIWKVEYFRKLIKSKSCMLIRVFYKSVILYRTSIKLIYDWMKRFKRIQKRQHPKILGFYNYFWQSIYTYMDRIDQVLAFFSNQKSGIVMNPKLKKKIGKIDSMSNLKSNFTTSNKRSIFYCDNMIKKGLTLKCSLFKEFSKPENLKIAWDSLRKESGKATPIKNIDQKVQIDLPWKYFFDISTKLITSSYKYTRPKETKIPKTFIKRTQRLKIESLQDKIVQKTLLNILSPIFEGQKNFEKFSTNNNKRGDIPPKVYEKSSVMFSKFSHGFRPNRSIHTVLKNIKYTWKSVTYFAVCDLEKSFNKINHTILINKIKSVIKEQKILDEIWKMLKTKSVSFNLKKFYGTNSLGEPNGAIIAPFLYNIYMSILDEYIEKYMKQKQKEIGKSSPKWTKAINIPGMLIPIKEQLKTKKELYRKTVKRGIKHTTKIITTEKLYYVRFANDFLLGYNGEKKKFKLILTKIQNFIKSDLQLKTTGFQITNAISDKTLFLGFELKLIQLKNILHKNNEIRQFKKLQLITTIKKGNEYNKYIQFLEWAGKKYYRNFILKCIRKPLQLQINKSELVSQLNQQGEYWAFKFLKNSLLEMKKSLPSEEITTSSVPHNKNFKYALKYREQCFNKKLLEWVISAKKLANIYFKKKFLRNLNPKIQEVFGKSRILFLESLKKVEQEKAKFFLKKNFLKNATPQKKNFSKKNLAVTITTTQQIKIFADIKTIEKNLFKKGFLDKKNRPIANSSLINSEDYQIITNYTHKGMGLLFFYSCADNSKQLKRIVDYKLRYSLAATLACKHKFSITQIFLKYGKNISIKRNTSFLKSKQILSSYLNKNFINTFKKQFQINAWPYTKLEDVLEKNWN